MVPLLTMSGRDREFDPVFVFRVPPDRQARLKILEWLEAEWEYMDEKWPMYEDDAHSAQGIQKDGWWEARILNYLGRAQILSSDEADADLSNPLAMQAVMKLFATVASMAESLVRVYGDPPKGGVASGELGDSG